MMHPLVECKDQLQEVFLRLPLTSLVRCRAVWKLWNSIITKPDFRAEYLRFPLRLCVGFFLYPTRSRFDDRDQLVRFHGDVSGRELIAGFPESRPLSERRFICSSNGVLLCYSMTGKLYIRAGDVLSMPELRYYVCNPMTKQWLEIPSPPRETVCIVGFHCRYPSVENGVRYEYEIVRVLLPMNADGLSNPNNTMVDIYSSRTRRWSRLQRPLKIQFNNWKYTSMVIRGVYYWLDDQQHFFLYDPVRDCLEEGPVPPDEEQRIREGQVWLSMDESDNRELVLYVGDNHEFRVWVRAVDAGDHEMPPVWQMKHQVDFAALIVQRPFDRSADRFLDNPRAVQMPGDPGKAIVGTEGRRVYFYDFGSGELQTPYDGRAICLGKKFNYFYCPYHAPRWHYRL